MLEKKNKYLGTKELLCQDSYSV